MNHLELGQHGEALATDHLLKNGYTVLHRNYRWKQAEIDIVCLFNDTLVIVEVKTRNSMALGSPSQAVTRTKQRQLIKATNAYIEAFKRAEEVRFDVISIVLNDAYTHIDHVENAFYPIR